MKINNCKYIERQKDCKLSIQYMIKFANLILKDTDFERINKDLTPELYKVAVQHFISELAKSED